jgi:hypothetical protein
MNVRKQVYKLTPQDFAAHPVWEFARDEEGVAGQDEATVRPFEVDGALEAGVGMFVVRATFTLADGSSRPGYLTPPPAGDTSLGTSQPIVVTDGGQVGFWRGMFAPDKAELDRCYSLLARTGDETFPVIATSAVDLVGGPVTVSIPGFLVCEDFRTQKIRIVK